MAVVSVTLLTAAAGCTPGDAERDAFSDGPVTFLPDDQVSLVTGFTARADDTVVFGLASIRNSGTSTATLTDASLDGQVPPSSAELVETRVIDPGLHHGTTVSAARWPYQDYTDSSEPLAGHVLGAGEEVELLFVVDVHETGSWTWPGSHVQYEVDDLPYQAGSSALVLRICAPRSSACSALPAGAADPPFGHAGRGDNVG